MLRGSRRPPVLLTISVETRLSCSRFERVTSRGPVARALLRMRSVLGHAGDSNRSIARELVHAGRKARGSECCYVTIWSGAKQGRVERELGVGERSIADRRGQLERDGGATRFHGCQRSFAAARSGPLRRRRDLNAGLAPRVGTRRSSDERDSRIAVIACIHDHTLFNRFGGSEFHERACRRTGHRTRPSFDAR